MDGIEPKIEPTEFIDVNDIKTEPLDTGSYWDPLDFQIKKEEIKVEIKEEIQDDGSNPTDNQEEDDSGDNDEEDDDDDEDDANSTPDDYSMSPQMSSPSQTPNSPDSTCKVEILEQPMKKIRFRYLSELQGTPHGPVLSEKSTKNHKSYPKVRLVGYDAGPKEVIKIRCWLVDKTNLPRGEERPHCHSLVMRKCSPRPGQIVNEPHEIIVSRANNYIAEFENMVVLHSVQKNLEKQYLCKLDQWMNRSQLATSMMSSSYDSELTQSEKKKVKEMIKSIDKNQVYLYFEAFIEYKKSVTILCSALSAPIRNLKNPVSGDLKICKVINSHGCCDGDTEVCIFVEKVPQDIKVRFYHENWVQDVTPDHIHRNCALSFRTPRFDGSIEEDTMVKFCLFRESDGAESNQMDFTYRPSESSYLLNSNKKRMRLDSSVQSPQSTMMDQTVVMGSYDNSPLSPSNDVIKPKIEIGAIEDLFRNYEVSGLDINPEYLLTVSPEGSLDEMPNSTNDRLENWSGSSLEAALQSSRDPMISGNVGPLETDGPSTLPHVSNYSSQIESHISELECKKIAVPQVKLPERLLKNILLSAKFKNHVNCLQKAVMSDDSQLLHKMFTALGSRQREYSHIIQRIRNDKYQSLLHLAVIHMKPDSYQVISILMKKGFDPMLRDSDGNTAYHLAVIVRQTPDALKALVTSSTDHALQNLMASNFQGFNILHLAVKLNKLDMAKYVLSLKSVDVDSVDSNSGDTALHIAARSLHYDMAKLLIDNGADKGKRNLSDYSPLQISVLRNEHRMAALLVAEGSDPHQQCLSLISQKFDENECDLNSCEMSGESSEEYSSVCCNSFALANDMQMCDVLSGKLKYLKLTEDELADSKTASSNGPLISPDEEKKLCDALGHEDTWKRLLEKLDVAPLRAVLNSNTFKNPEKVLVNYLIKNQNNVFGGESGRAKLRKMLQDICLDPKEILLPDEVCCN